MHVPEEFLLIESRHLSAVIFTCCMVIILFLSLSVLSKQHRKSAVELLEESKSLYVKSESVRDQKQLPKNAENLQLGARYVVLVFLATRGFSCQFGCPMRRLVDAVKNVSLDFTEVTCNCNLIDGLQWYGGL